MGLTKMEAMKILRQHFRKVASLGGKARAASMTPARRSEIARAAVMARWAKAAQRKAGKP